MTATFFSAINLKNGIFWAICYISYSKETRLVKENLVTLCKEYFGAPPGVWFTLEACDEASLCTFNRETSTIEEDGNVGTKNMDILEAFGHDMIEVARRRALENYEVLPDSNVFDRSISPDDNEGDQGKTVFVLPQIFQLQPSTEGALGIDDHHPLATNATGVSNATKEMSQAVANSSFPVSDIQDDDAITIIRRVTNATALSSTLNSTGSSNSPAPKTGVLHSPKYGRGKTTR